ncbi:MAG: hypothetical protein JSW39_15490, partial [Desulfobacterales bacterium]
MKALITIGLVVCGLLRPPCGWTYPLDGYPFAGILRLEGFRLVQKGKVRGIRLPRGALLNSAQVDLRLLGQTDFATVAPDPEFTRQLQRRGQCGHPRT